MRRMHGVRHRTERRLPLSAMRILAIISPHAGPAHSQLAAEALHRTAAG